eukprot:m.65462 g.65462  ORF g.65462 m.65462 type:complete len:523 (-) comp11736_c0_seq1:131-1699(-)
MATRNLYFGLLLVFGFQISIGTITKCIYVNEINKTLLTECHDKIQGGDGFGAKLSRLLLDHLYAAAGCVNLGCLDVLSLVQPPRNRSDIVQLHHIVQLEPNGLQKPIFCHKTIQKYKTYTHGSIYTAEGWQDFRCYESHFQELLKGWANCSTERYKHLYRTPFAWCSRPIRRRKDEWFLEEDMVLKSADSKERSRVELERIRKAWKVTRETDNMKCGFSKRVLNFVVHIRAGDRLAYASEHHVYTLVYDFLKALMSVLKSHGKKIRFHIVSETRANAPDSEGLFDEFGSRLRFKPSLQQMQEKQNLLPVQFLASLDDAPSDDPLGNIHLLLNTEPVWSLKCVAQADALLITHLTNFPLSAATLGGMPVALFSVSEDHTLSFLEELKAHDIHMKGQLFNRAMEYFFTINKAKEMERWHFLKLKNQSFGTVNGTRNLFSSPTMKRFASTIAEMMATHAGDDEQAFWQTLLDSMTSHGRTIDIPYNEYAYKQLLFNRSVSKQSICDSLGNIPTCPQYEGLGKPAN